MLVAQVVAFGAHLGHGLGARRSAIHARQAPIHHIDLAVGTHHDVGGLEVAVHDSLVVGVSHGITDLQQCMQRARGGPVVRLLLYILEDRVQVLAIHQAHREVHATITAQAQFVHRNDARVLQLRGDLRLFQKPTQGAAIHCRCVTFS